MNRGFALFLFMAFIISTVVADFGSFMEEDEWNDEDSNYFPENDQMDDSSLSSNPSCNISKNIDISNRRFANFWTTSFPFWYERSNATCQWNFETRNESVLMLQCPYIYVQSPDMMIIQSDDGTNITMDSGTVRNYKHLFSSVKASVTIISNHTGKAQLGFICTMKRIDEKPLPSICYCGEPIETPRLLNSADTQINEFKWMAHFHQSNTSDEPACAGSLINDRFVVTAESCLRTVGSKPIIQLGNYNSSAMTPSADTFSTTMKNKITHPDFDENTLNHNIAIVELEVPVNFRFYKNIRPICLPQTNSESYNGEQSVTAGYGHTALGFTHHIRKVQSEIYSCSNSCGSNNFPVPGNYICAGKDETSSFCQGDLGNPLMVLNNGTYELVGTAPSDSDCTAGPLVFLRTTAYADWIKANAYESTNCPRKP